MKSQNYEITDWFLNEVQVNEPALRAYLNKEESEPADVDDIMQETYRRIIEVKKKQPIKSTKGLLITIAKNVSRDRVRKKYASKKFSVAYANELSDLDKDKQPLDNLVRSDDISMLESAIRSLPPRCRKVMVLRTFKGLSYKEIAEELGVSVSTVETQLARGLHRCRKFFKRNGYSFEEGKR